MASFYDIIKNVRSDCMTAKYDAVLFDFDGTVADTGEGIFSCVKIAIEQVGFAPLDEKLIRTFIGPPIFDSFKFTAGMSDEQSERAVAEYRKAYSAGGIYKFRLYDGIEALFRKLHENGVKIAIASSKPAVFINRIIDFLDFGDIIDCVSCPDFDNDHKSKKELILNAVYELGVNKERTLMVGDRHFDIDGASLAGVESVGVTFGYGGEEELKKAGATYIAGSADEIDEIIFS